MILNGYDLKLYNNDNTQILGACKGVEIMIDQELDEVPSSTTPGWKTYIKKRKGWKFTINNLVNASTLSNAASMVGTSYNCCFYNGTPGTYDTPMLQGTAICTQAKITEQKSSVAKGSFTFVGISALS